MATKAQLFRYRQERSGPKRAPVDRETRKGGLPRGVDPGELAAAGPVALRTPAKRVSKKSTVVLEASATGWPSRKSSRRGLNRGKPDASLHVRTTNKVRSPEARAAKALVRRK